MFFYIYDLAEVSNTGLDPDPEYFIPDPRYYWLCKNKCKFHGKLLPGSCQVGPPYSFFNSFYGIILLLHV